MYLETLLKTLPLSQVMAYAIARLPILSFGDEADTDEDTSSTTMADRLTGGTPTVCANS